ncbi:MAG TPA: GNAT family N-acetyltransferase [Candidatus Dormibacteraeota bacterium]|nr:GNAT family N-acetyltransferase [Candidatus Dormibacteraeota bacterium]
MTLDTRLIDSPEAAQVDGLRLRHWSGPAELPAMHAIAGAARAAAGIVESSSLEAMANEYAHLTNSDPDRDVVIAEIDGRPAAYGRTWWADRTSGERAFEAVCFVHPDHQRRGIGRALLAAQDRHRLAQASSMLASGDLGDRPAILTAYLEGLAPGGEAMLASRGYRLARRHAEMRRMSLEELPVLPLPEGIELRGVEPGDRAAMRRAFEIDAEVFRDHWGDVDDSETAWQSWLTDPETQPGLWVVAVDRASGEVAGQILNYVAPGPDGEPIGWTESIAVRRPWRRRGLASAMLAASLRRVRDAGAASAALGVDLENEHRASAIYERLGFRVTVEHLEFHRRLEPAEIEEAAR